MFPVANQTSLNLNKMVDAWGSNQMKMVHTLPLHFQDPREIKNMTCWDVGVQDIAGESAPLPDKGIIFLLDPTLQGRTKVIDQI